ncbi:hypothetical protein EV702DRAFT_1192354 [Suillus placidus]|uniref:Uncharacterized protein n=1 Tax=Suillus placidus TaxID=48579 RepID=A0A9P7D735_9AGAM|nr:hypothetical protein EV702DRAFT_1192354 [Suillus placidus]
MIPPTNHLPPRLRRLLQRQQDSNIAERSDSALPPVKELEPDLSEVVVTISPKPKPTNIVEEAQEDSVTSRYSSRSRDDDVYSLGTESEVSAVNSSELGYLADHDDNGWESSSLRAPSQISPLGSPYRERQFESGDSLNVQSECQDPLNTHSPLDCSEISAKETQYWDLAPPAPPQWRSLRDWRYCPSCENPHPAGELSRLLCVEVGLQYMKDCDGPTVEVGRKRKREE